MLHVFRHELRLIFRDPRFWIPFIIPPVILAASQAIAVSRYGGQIMQGMEGYMMLLLGCLMAPMGAPLAADSFAGERERNSLELLQLSPIAPTSLFWGKLLAILPFPVLFAILAQVAYWFAHPEIPSGSLRGASHDVVLAGTFPAHEDGTCGDAVLAVLYRAAPFVGAAQLRGFLAGRCRSGGGPGGICCGVRLYVVCLHAQVCEHVR